MKYRVLSIVSPRLLLNLFHPSMRQDVLPMLHTRENIKKKSCHTSKTNSIFNVKILNIF